MAARAGAASARGFRLCALVPVLVACFLGSVATGGAAAATGDLIQKPGAAGCLSAFGTCLPGTALDSPRAVTVSPDGRNAYVTSDANDAVAILDRAPNGSLAQKLGTAGCISETGAGPCVDGRALDGALAIAVSPDGANVYAASLFSDAVVVFDRGPDGSLVQKAGTAGCVSETGSGGACVDGTALNGANSVAVSPDGASVYVVSSESDAVAIFDRGPNGGLAQKLGLAGCVSETGAGPCAGGKALDEPSSVVVSPDGRNVYVTTRTSDAVAIFDRAPGGGLTQKLGTAGCISETGSGGACVDGKILNGANSVAVSPDGASAYVASFGSEGIAILDRAPNGTLTQKPGTAGCVSETGSGGACVDGTAVNGGRSVAVSPDGASAYLASFSSDAVTILNRAPDGGLAQRPGTAGCISESGSGGACVDGAALDGASSVAVSPDGASAYVASQFSSAVAIFDRELPQQPLPPPQSPPPAPPPSAERPQLDGLSLSPARFAAANRGPAIATTRANRRSTISYRLSEPARVSFTVQRALPGRRASGNRCAKPARANRNARPCTRFVGMRGSFAHNGQPGHNSLRFSGRLAGSKLPPGTYRLRAVATNAAGSTSQPPQHKSFRITRR